MPNSELIWRLILSTPNYALSSIDNGRRLLIERKADGAIAATTAYHDSKAFFDELDWLTMGTPYVDCDIALGALFREYRACLGSALYLATKAA